VRTAPEGRHSRLRAEQKGVRDVRQGGIYAERFCLPAKRCNVFPDEEKVARATRRLA
jgi:hypothetical protein